MFGRLSVIASPLLLAACNAVAPDTVASLKSTSIESNGMVRFAEECEPWDDWDKPAKPFRIYGNSYYVGTCGIAAIYIADELGDTYIDSNTLIDTGTRAGVETVITNIAALRPHISGPPMVSRVLYSHEHFDHVGGHAKLQKLAPKAEFYSSPQAAQVFHTGKDHPEDPQFGMHDAMEPVRIDRIAENGAVIGPKRIAAIETPGHSPGAMSWQWKECEGNDCKIIVYADSLSPISRNDYRFSDNPDYIAAYRAGLDRLAKLDCDILLTPHPSHSKMIERAATGTLEGGVSCSAYAAKKHRDLDARLTKEAAE